MFKLLRYFSLTSLLAFVLIIAALAYFNNRLAMGNLVALEESKNIALTQSFANSLWAEFAPFVANSAGMTGDELRSHPEVLAFHEAVLGQMEGLSVLKMKVYNLEGLTVYSSDFSQIGDSKRDNPGFQAGLAGGTASKLTYRDTFNAFEGVIAQRDIVESYVPLRQGPTGPVEAVTELYDDVTPLLQRVNATQQGITALLLTLYGVLFTIVRRADKILQQQYRDLEHANLKLAKQSQELERSNAELEQFAYTASHDLQEPLRKIQAFGDYLMESQREVLGDDALYLERMQDAACRMRQLIQDLLNYSRVGSKGGAFVSVDLSVDLSRLAQEVAADLEVRTEETGGRLELSALPTIEADPTQMRQLLQNLLGNALKFSRPDTPPVVKVWGEEQGEHVTLFVQDNGIGFDQKYAERVFAMFQRLHGRSAYEGTGMGLAIVRKIVERHQGEVSVQSEEGVGTTFTITLPVTSSASSQLATPEPTPTRVQLAPVGALTEVA